MMSDVFKEQLVEVKKTPARTFKKAGIIFTAIIIGFAAFMFAGPFIGPLVVVGVMFGARYLVKKLNLEYEYALTNDELDIDKIINKERRKRLFTVHIKDIELMAHIKDGMKKAEMGRAEKTIDVSSGEHGPDTYVIIFRHENKLTKLIFEPNDDIQQNIFRQAPSKVFLQR